MRVNVLEPASLMREALRHFRAAGGGTLVTLSSWAAQRGSAIPRLTGYAASKAAIKNLAQTIALNYARDGVLAYVVAPGIVRTRMSEISAAARGGIEAVNAMLTLGEMVPPEEVARSSSSSPAANAGTSPARRSISTAPATSAERSFAREPRPPRALPSVLDTTRTVVHDPHTRTRCARSSVTACPQRPPPAESATMTSPGSSPHDTPSHRRVATSSCSSRASEVVRDARGPARHRPDRPRGRARRHLRALGLGQVDAAAHDQPARGARRRLGAGARRRVRPRRRAGERRGGASSCGGASAWCSSSSTCSRT